MATSQYQLPGVFHSRVYRSNVQNAFFILVPDVKLSDPSVFETQVFEVKLDPRSDGRETYQVFQKGRRREDLETGMRIVGQHWGTHTVLEPGVNVEWAEIEKFRTQFHGTGCLLLVLSLPLTMFAVGGFCATARLLL